MKKTGGFTIVELLIVIVVIAILAAISIVAYSGVDRRATISAITQDLESVNKAIQLYYVENDAYPSTSNRWYGYVGGVRTTDYVPGLVPKYISALPQPKNKSDSLEYIYRSNGSEYKLIVHDNGGASGTGFARLCSDVRADLKDPSRTCWAAGYWSAGGRAY